MAKKDQFAKFRDITIGSGSSPLTDALTQKSHREEPVETPAPAPAPAQTPTAPVSTPAPAPAPAPEVKATSEKVSKNANRELVSFHISKETKKRLNLLKVETEKSLGDLYNEAIEDLLLKYSKK